VVIAFERTRIVTGYEKPDSPQQKEIFNERHPTVWNHMEAAMAYAQKVPILTFVQPGLKRQGMLSDRFEWKAMETELDPSFLLTEEFRQVFGEWIALVRNRPNRQPVKDFDPGDLKVGALLQQLNAKQATAAIMLLLAAAGSLSTLAFKAGQAWQESMSSAPKQVMPQSDGSPASPPKIGRQ
jgi:hypothetical protein